MNGHFSNITAKQNHFLHQYQGYYSNFYYRTVNARASWAGGWEFEPILHSVANGSPPLQHLRR